MKPVAKFCLTALFLLHILSNGIVGSGRSESHRFIGVSEQKEKTAYSAIICCVAVAPVLICLPLFMTHNLLVARSRIAEVAARESQLEKLQEEKFQEASKQQWQTFKDFAKCDSSRMHEWRKIFDHWMPCCTTETNEACEIRNAGHKVLTESCPAQYLQEGRAYRKLCCDWENPLDCFMREDGSKIKRSMIKKKLRQIQQAQQRKLFGNSSMLSARGNRNHNGDR